MKNYGLKDHFCYYLDLLYREIPNVVYGGILSVFILGAIVIFALLGWNRGWRTVARMMLVEIILLIYCSTFVFRQYAESYGYNYHPLWSYMAIRQEGKEILIAEIIMNVVVFLPVGLLMGCAYKSMRWLKVFLLGLCVSSSIEVMQFVFKRGFSEIDDILHNTLGCMIGFGIYRIGVLALKNHF